jgi:hypothetical protein
LINLPHRWQPRFLNAAKTWVMVDESRRAPSSILSRDQKGAGSYVHSTLSGYAVKKEKPSIFFFQKSSPHS